MQATTPIPQLAPSVASRDRHDARSPARNRVWRRALGWLGLAGVVVSALWIAAAAAAHPTVYAPASRGHYPGWLAGPLRGLGVDGLGPHSFQNLLLAMCASYLLVLGAARVLSLRAVVTAVVAAHLVLFLGPVLLSQDLFGYLSFARLGALHGLDPYTHFSAAMPRAWGPSRWSRAPPGAPRIRPPVPPRVRRPPPWSASTPSCSCSPSGVPTTTP
jgi:hypothetical protein